MEDNTRTALAVPIEGGPVDTQSGHGTTTEEGPVMMHSRNRLQGGPFVLDLTRWELTVAGRLVRLTAHQFLLMKELMRRPGVFLGRHELIELVFGDAAGGRNVKAIDQLVHRTRRRIGPAADGCLECMRGVGYRLRDNVGEGTVLTAGRRPAR